MDDVISYIRQKYNPVGIIVYGSFADGSNNDHSDFDALAITNGGERAHDASVVNGTQLDLFVYPAKTFSAEVDWEDFVQVYDGVIALDTDDAAYRVRESVKGYVDGKPRKTPEENRENLEWCDKMLARAGRKDAEGFYRQHWLTIDSLEIYCDLAGWTYFGPKKTLRKMRGNDATGYEIYGKALETFELRDLERWVSYLKEINAPAE